MKPRRSLTSRRALKPGPTPKQEARTALITAANAFLAGQSEASLHPGTAQEKLKALVNQLWGKYAPWQENKINWELYHAAAKQFLAGFAQQARIQLPSWVLMPAKRTSAVIIAVMNEEKTIAEVIRQLERLPLDEIIIVINGSKDASFRKARAFKQPIIIRYVNRLGHDVGRAIGAKIAKSDILLFLDGDIPIFAEHLLPFLHAIDQGADLALNNITPFLQPFAKRDAVTIMKQFLNESLGRPDLKANSLTAVPHAISRKALQEIGYKTLMVPPKAQAAAIRHNLAITAPASINVIDINKIREQNVGQLNPVASMIIGDHIEAVAAVPEDAGKTAEGVAR